MASIQNPEEQDPAIGYNTATIQQRMNALVQKIEERNRICNILDEEIATMRRSLGQTVDSDDSEEEDSMEQRVAAGRARTAAWVDARNVPLDSLDFGVSQRVAVPAGMARTATWVDDYNRRSRAAAELSLQNSTGHRFDGGRRTRRKSQRRKKLSKRRKTRRKRKKRKTKKRKTKKRKTKKIWKSL